MLFAVLGDLFHIGGPTAEGLCSGPLFRWVRPLEFQKGSFKDLGFEVRGSKTGCKGRVFAIPGRGLPVLRLWGA